MTFAPAIGSATFEVISGARIRVAGAHSGLGRIFHCTLIRGCAETDGASTRRSSPDHPFVLGELAGSSIMKRHHDGLSVRHGLAVPSHNERPSASPLTTGALTKD